MIRVEVTNAFVTGSGTEFLVLLKSAADDRVLPISIGRLEAQSIAIKLNNVEFPRPLTHDLFKNTLDAIGCSLGRVEITDLRDDTYYSRLIVEMHGILFEIDSRPSDAIALALRFGAPVYVEEKVFDLAGVVFSAQEQEKADEAGTREEPSSVLSLQWRLDAAIKNERYEDAARLRDDIKRLTRPN